MTGGALVKPKDVLKPSVKSEVRNGNKGMNHDSKGDGGGVAKAERPGDAPTPKYVPKDASGNPMALPRTDGKMVNGTVHVPESMNPHTQIGWQKGRKGDYIQTLEWGENGVPVNVQIGLTMVVRRIISIHMTILQSFKMAHGV